MQWLLINQETFIWINKEIGLIYDTGKLNETASGGNPDGRFPVALYTLKI